MRVPERFILDARLRGIIEVLFVFFFQLCNLLLESPPGLVVHFLQDLLVQLLLGWRFLDFLHAINF